MLFRFNKFINEEIRIEKMDEPTLVSLKKNLMFRLGEYRTYILANIEYNFTTNKVEYKKFDKIDIPVITRELTNEFTAEVVEDEPKSSDVPDRLAILAGVIARFATVGRAAVPVGLADRRAVHRRGQRH